MEAGQRMARIITFGEIMLRLKAPGRERLFQSPVLEATFGGGEANVACGLACFGLDVAFVTVIPNNPVGDACIAELRKWNIGTEYISRLGNRLGIYFLEPGANQRPSKVLYDRSYSAISELQSGVFDWENIFNNADWFHISGITPAISRNTAKESIHALQLARELGLTISCDLNFRKKLWKYGSDPKEVMGEIVKYVDVVIGNEEDYQKTLGISSDVNVESGELNKEAYKKISDQVLLKFKNVKMVAITMRESYSADYNGWSCLLNNRRAVHISRHYNIHNIVDRVGAGDTFAAGLIYGLNQLQDDKDALEFASAASCLMHSIPGDFPVMKNDEVENLMHGFGSGRVQR